MDQYLNNAVTELAGRHNVTQTSIMCYMKSAVELQVAGDLDTAVRQAHLVLEARDMSAQSFTTLESWDQSLDRMMSEMGLTYPYTGKHRA